MSEFSEDPAVGRGKSTADSSVPKSDQTSAARSQAGGSIAGMEVAKLVARKADNDGRPKSAKTMPAIPPLKPGIADHASDAAIEKLARKQARVGQAVFGPKP